MHICLSGPKEKARQAANGIACLLIAAAKGTREDRRRSRRRDINGYNVDGNPSDILASVLC